VTSESDRLPTTGPGETHARARLLRAALGWLAHAGGAGCLILLVVAQSGTVAAWHGAWAAVVLLASGIAFRAGDWFQRPEPVRRRGRRLRPGRASWSLTRCLAMLVTGGALVAAGCIQVFAGDEARYVPGPVIWFALLVGAGGAMLFVGLWELHRRLHPHDLEAVLRRQRLFAGGGAVVWTTALYVALLLGVLVFVVGMKAFGDMAPVARTLGVFAFLLALIVLFVVVGATAKSAHRQTVDMQALERSLALRRGRRAAAREREPRGRPAPTHHAHGSQ